MLQYIDVEDLEPASSSTTIYHPTDVMIVQDVVIIYKDIISKNSHFVHTCSGISNYGEVSEKGVD
jgi:uncharacterized metal-binding protein